MTIFNRQLKALKYVENKENDMIEKEIRKLEELERYNK
jgi:hypothetical protein